MTETSPCTLFVGNLIRGVSEDLVAALFSQMGAVKGCKIIRKAGNDPYAFVEYMRHASAAAAIQVMNKRIFFDKEIKVKWFDKNKSRLTRDLQNHFHVFVGDLGYEVSTETLRELFGRFGEISYCRIVCDPVTKQSRGYAFISYVNRAEAEAAILTMNGKYIGSRSIRTNWSTRKPTVPRDPPQQPTNSFVPPNRTSSAAAMPTQLTKQCVRPTFLEVLQQASANNKTVYCGGFPPNFISGVMLQKIFQQFGHIRCIRVFKPKGYAFVRFYQKEAAALAIERIHKTQIAGATIKCCWSRENGGDIIVNNHYEPSAHGRAVVGANCCDGGDADSAIAMTQKPIGRLANNPKRKFILTPAKQQPHQQQQQHQQQHQHQHQQQQRQIRAPELAAQSVATYAQEQYQYDNGQQHQHQQQEQAQHTQQLWYYYPPAQAANASMQQQQQHAQQQYVPHNYYNYDANNAGDYTTNTQQVLPGNYHAAPQSNGNWQISTTDGNNSPAAPPVNTTGYSNAMHASTAHYASSTSHLGYNNTIPHYRTQ